MYKLFLGFRKMGEYVSISIGKKIAGESGQTGVFNLIGDDYSDSWYVFKKEASMMTVTDKAGKIIEVTDLDDAIRECEMCADSPFKLESGYTGGENHRFMLEQLLKLKQEQRNK
ncbi:hypothetical protein SAMN05216357_11285 [Porphyromonadaceae bacterium KH3CP3RA]|nr:hypothetical protein SAMN05216357_11285 [Porphyromonadaceae bacterium KH3CP3RA]